VFAQVFDYQPGRANRIEDISDRPQAFVLAGLLLEWDAD
jgi:hypothetical protein